MTTKTATLTWHNHFGPNGRVETVKFETAAELDAYLDQEAEMGVLVRVSMLWADAQSLGLCKDTMGLGLDILPCAGTMAGGVVVHDLR